MDDWFLIPRPGPRHGRVYVEVLTAKIPAQELTTPQLLRLFDPHKRKPKTANIRPAFDPQAPTMGPWDRRES